MSRLKGKVAIVTGAAKGIGAADARVLAREGAQVILCDVDKPMLMETAKAVGSNGEAYILDVIEEENWVELIKYVEHTYKRLDILVNNAGVVAPGTIETQSEEDYRLQMAVSADGTFFGCKHALPAMVRSGGGSIINMASVAAIQGERYVVGYSAAKGAITAMSRSIAAHCAIEKNNVRCNAVCPSGVVTPMVEAMEQKMIDAGLGHVFELESEASGASKLGTAEDIGNVVLFLASDESHFINGATISADQGMSIIAGVVPE